jgi:uncharacterized protein YkwD
MTLTGNMNHEGFSSRCDSIQNYSCSDEMGEVIAFNYLTAHTVLLAWDNSPEHKMIIADPRFNSVGVCVLQNPISSKIYYMAILAKI